MKKQLFFLLFLIGFGAVYAQTNLVINPGFETWPADTLISWSHSSALTPIKETTIVKEGSSAVRFESASSTNFYQYIHVTAGKVYTLSFDYYIISGDGTDVRIWSGFKNSSTNSSMSATDMTTLGIFNNLRGPGGSSSTAYFPDVRGAWQHYTTSFTAPTGYDLFTYQINLYSASKSVWDNFSLVEGLASAVPEVGAESSIFFVSGKSLVAENIPDGTIVEMYNAVGIKVLSTVITNGKVELSNLTTGVYIVRTNTTTQKIML